MCVLWTNIWGPVRGPHYEGLLSKNYLFKRTFSVGTRKCPHNFNRPHFAGVFSYECPRKCATVRAHTHIHTHTHTHTTIKCSARHNVAIKIHNFNLNRKKNMTRNVAVLL